MGRHHRRHQSATNLNILPWFLQHPVTAGDALETITKQPNIIYENNPKQVLLGPGRKNNVICARIWEVQLDIILEKIIKKVLLKPDLKRVQQIRNFHGKKGYIYNAGTTKSSCYIDIQRIGSRNERIIYSFFFSTVTIATHLPSILSNSQIRLSPSFKSKWSLKGAGTVVLKLLAWFAFVNLVLKPDIKFSYYYYLFKYLFSYLIRYFYIILGNTIGNDDYLNLPTNKSMSKMGDLMKTININHIFSLQIYDDIFQIFKTFLKRLFFKNKLISYYLLYIIIIDLSIFLSSSKDYIRDNVIISSIFYKLMTLSPGGLKE